MYKVLKATFLVFLFSGFSFHASAQKTFPLVKGDMVPAIVISGDIDHPEKFDEKGWNADCELIKAAFDLSDYIWKITGRRPQVLAEGKGFYEKPNGNWKFVGSVEKCSNVNASNPRIHVGWTSEATKKINKEKLNKLDIDGFTISAMPNDVFLVGKTKWGSVFACFQFLEEFCNVRWFLPGEFGEDVVRQPELSVPVMEKSYIPAYHHRWFNGSNWRTPQDLKRWQLHMKLHKRVDYSHAMGIVFDSAKYADKYREIYPLPEGGKKRKIPASLSRSGWQPCFSNPKTIDLTIDYAKEYFSKYPEATSISIGINDGGVGWCECEECKKQVEIIDGKESRSRLYYTYANKVAERFKRLFSDKKIGLLIYGKVANLPDGMKMDNCLVGFICMQHGNLIEPELKRQFEKKLQETANAFSEFGFHDLFYSGCISVPRLAMHQVQYYLEHGHKMGARHINPEAYMNWGLDGFRYWIYAKLMWNPSLDVKTTTNEFFSRFFKEAAQPMKDYFNLVEKYTCKPVFYKKDGETNERLANFARQAEQFETFPPEAIKKCEPHLEKAMKMAKQPITVQRVRYFYDAFNLAKILSLRYHYSKEALSYLQSNDLPKGIAVLTKLMAPDLDMKQYIDWILKDDPYCVRTPEPAMFSKTTMVYSEIANKLSSKIIDSLKSKIFGKSLNLETVKQASREALTELTQDIAGNQSALNLFNSQILPIAEKIMFCPKTEAPQIDGKFDDPCWTKAPVYGGFLQFQSGLPAEHKTQIQAVHNGNKLFVAITCHQDTSKLLVWTKERDDRVYYEDGIEFMLNKPSDTEIDQRFQVIFNSRGNIFDFYNGSSAWNGDIEVAVNIQPEFYTIEFSVPLQSIGLDAKTHLAKINVVRNFFGYNSFQKKQHPVERSNWFPALDNNVTPKSRGWLIFE